MIDPLAVLFEDSHVLAVAKPAGVLTQGTPGGEPTLEEAVKRYLGGASASPYLATVHRLDRPVSGVVVWAKTPKAARRLAEQFAARQTVKEYWAVVAIQPEAPALAESGVWDDWLTGSTDALGVVRASTPEAPGARRALTRYQLGASARLPEGMAWLRLWPETGRTHQLRVQASLRGRPVWGDVTYGSTRTFLRGIALHARSLSFRHPILRRELTVTAPLPEVWSKEGVGLRELA